MSVTRTQVEVLKSLNRTLLSGGRVEYRDEYNRIHSVYEVDIDSGKIYVACGAGTQRWVSVFLGPDYVQIGKSSKRSARIMHGDPAVLGAKVKIRFGETKIGYSDWY